MTRTLIRFKIYSYIFYFLIFLNYFIHCSPVHILEYIVPVAYIWTLERGTPSRSMTGNFVSPGIESPATESAKLSLPVHVLSPPNKGFMTQLARLFNHYSVNDIPPITFVISSAFLNKKSNNNLKFDSLCGVEEVQFSQLVLKANNKRPVCNKK